MSALAAFIMRGRWQAVIAIVILTVISWGLSLASLLAMAALALPTLRLGSREGLKLALMALPGVAIAGQLIIGDAAQVALYTGAMWIPMLVVAILLRESSSLILALMAAVSMGWLLVAGVYLFVGDPSSLWLDQLEQMIRPMMEQGSNGVELETLKQNMARFSHYVTGAIAAGSVLTLIASLLLARWWQAGLYNPGGFRSEFLQLRFPSWFAFTVMGIAAVALLPDTGMTRIAANMALPAMAAFMVGGFSLAHSLLSRSSSGRFWLVGLYITIMFVTPLMVLVALAGLTDSWMNWRHRAESRAL